MSKMTTLENRLYDLYLEYFKTAEATRRWDPFEDIPWDKASATRADVPDDIAEIAEAYFAVEVYLPDYTSKILHMIRQSRGRHLFQCNWGYEESKHGKLHAAGGTAAVLGDLLQTRAQERQHGGPLRRLARRAAIELADGATHDGQARLERAAVRAERAEDGHRVGLLALEGDATPSEREPQHGRLVCGRVERVRP